MTTSRLNRWFLAAMFCVLFTTSAAAQNSEIRGMVTDQTKAVIPAAEVAVTNVDTGVTHAVRANEAGLYAVPLLKEGRYKIVCRLPGFSTQHAEVNLQIGQVAQVDCLMRVGEVTEVVEVVGSGERLQTKATDVGQVIDQAQIRELPLNGRNFLQLAQLTNGVVRSGQGGRGHRTTEVGGFVAGGNHVTQNNIILDGSDITSRTSRGALGFEAEAVQPPTEALSEFKVVTNNISAEYGERLGAKILVSTRSGTNEWHGALFEFHRNDKVAANNFFFNRNRRPAETGERQPKYLRNQFGGTLGGPIARDKTFFFGSYQGTRIRRGQSFTSSVPSPSVRQGDFSQEIAQRRNIYDPLTIVGAGANAVRQPFAQNRIPANRWDATSRAILELYPMPNIAGRENLALNHFASPGQSSDQHQYDFRVDHNFAASHRVFGRYSLRDEFQRVPGQFNLPADEDGGQITDIKGHNLAFHYTAIPSATATNEFRFGWTWFPTAYDIPATENLNQKFGIKGAVGSAFGQHDRGLAMFSPTGFSTIGSRCCWPNNDELTNFQFADDFLWLRRKHSLRAGVDYRFINKASLSGVNSRGSFGFSGEYTSQFPNVAGSRASTGNPIGDFLLGWASGGGSSSPAGENTDYHYYGLYVQDDWRITPKLTFNLGLRWELFSGPYHPNPEKQLLARLVLRNDPNYAALDDDSSPQINAQFQEYRFPANENDCGCKLDRNNFAPRLGFAYQPGKNTVIRAGAGLYYGFQDYLGVEDGRYYAQAPLVRNLPPVVNREQAVYRVSQGLPPLPPPFPANQFPNGQGAVVVPEFLPTPYVAQWFFDVQRQLPWSIVLTVGYNGTKSTHLSGSRNPTDPGPHATIPWPMRQRFGNHLITKYDNTLNSNYNAMNIKAEKRFGRDLTFLNAFTWAKTIDYGRELLASSEGGRASQAVTGLWRERARSTRMAPEGGPFGSADVVGRC